MPKKKLGVGHTYHLGVWKIDGGLLSALLDMNIKFIVLEFVWSFSYPWSDIVLRSLEFALLVAFYDTHEMSE